jgi:hypothetical protein
MVLSTKAKIFESAMSESGRVDFWDSMEPQVILNMKEMKLEELINLIWSAQKVKKGSKLFYEEFEKELTKRIQRVKDEEFHTLISCFNQDESALAEGNVSSRFMKILL